MTPCERCGAPSSGVLYIGHGQWGCDSCWLEAVKAGTEAMRQLAVERDQLLEECERLRARLSAVGH